MPGFDPGVEPLFVDNMVGTPSLLTVYQVVLLVFTVVYSALGLSCMLGAAGKDVDDSANWVIFVRLLVAQLPHPHSTPHYPAEPGSTTPPSPGTMGQPITAFSIQLP